MNFEPSQLQVVKQQWNQILDAVLLRDRVAWLAFFDARLISLEAGNLLLGFDDSKKFSGDHDFSLARNPKHIALLVDCIREISGLTVRVSER